MCHCTGRESCCDCVVEETKTKEKSCDTCKWNDTIEYGCLNTVVVDCCEPKYEGWEPIDIGDGYIDIRKTLAWGACPTETESKNTLFHKIAGEIADLVEEKNKAYGNSFSEAEEFLKLLYPKGVEPKDFSNMLTLVRIWDKIKRIATNKDAFGESPYKDILGYCLLRLRDLDE